MTFKIPSSKRFSSRLTTWYRRNKRDLPWRHTSDPYAIFVSELMLQQTQVSTVIPYYHKFMQRFPTVAALAAADLQEVLRMWAGLGYYRRARHMHTAAQQVVANHDGRFPNNVAQLLQLPGIGRYTAGAIASIAFNQPAPIVDGNVMRVLARITNLQDDISTPATQKKLWHIAETLTPSTPTSHPGDYNQAIMELGATICLPHNPQCPRCPLRQMCQAFVHGTQNSVPIKSAKPKAKTVRRFAFVLCDEDRVLLLQRPKGVVWEDLWEFPALDLAQFNLQRKISDEIQQRLHQYLEQQLGLIVGLDPWESRLTHQLTHRTFEYRIFRGRLLRRPGAPQRLPACDSGRYVDHRWVRQRELDTLPVGRITHKLATAALK